MDVLVPILIAITAGLFVLYTRRRRDHDEVMAHLRERGGELIRLTRTKKGHPFPDTGRGWWAWQVLWRDGGGEHSAWVLTTRDGIADWQDPV